MKVTVTSPTVVTAATLIPATITGSAKGISAQDSPGRCIPPRAASTTEGQTVDPGDDVAHQDQQRVADQSDLAVSRLSPVKGTSRTKRAMLGMV